MTSQWAIRGVAATGLALLVLSEASAQTPSVPGKPPGLTDAEYYQEFVLPSGNIFCQLDPGEGGTPSAVRCQLKQLSTKPPPAPSDCRASWGDEFQILYAGTIAERVCHAASDSLIKSGYPVLAYGATWKVNGFVCTSATSGITCVNPQGHGFTLSREAQKLF